MQLQQDTKDPEYAQMLKQIQGKWWKKSIKMVDPYKWNINRLNPGFCLDIGCGVGRNLAHLNGNGVGVDHNYECVEFCNVRGFKSFLPSDFKKSQYSVENTFDSLLLAHVAEHMSMDEVIQLISSYLVYLKEYGKVILITPQERGQRSDPTHVEFMDFQKLDTIGEQLFLEPITCYSYPFPRWLGNFYIYNEFIWVGEKVTSHNLIKQTNGIGKTL